MKENNGSTRRPNHFDGLGKQSKFTAHVLGRRLKLTRSEFEASTWFVLAMPAHGKGNVVRTVKVWACSRDFQDKVIELIQKGYLPLGIVEMTLGMREFFVELKAEIGAQEFDRLAAVGLEKAYDSMAQEGVIWGDGYLPA